MNESPRSAFSPTRAIALLCVLLTALSALVARVAYLQTYGRQTTILRAENQQHMGERLASRRGTIFDATGNILAGTIEQKGLFVDPKFMFEQFAAEGLTNAEIRSRLSELANLTDTNLDELMTLLDERMTARFVKLAHNVDSQIADAIRKLDLPGVGFFPVHVRNYPMGNLAAHILGGVGAEGNGLEGLELKYNKLLSGKDGSKRTLKDARRRGILVAADDYIPPEHGQHLVLTIDSNIQLMTEQELAATCLQFKAARGEAVVLDPRTGKVLAMANWPTFSPEHLEDSKPDQRRNRCVTDPYEPGSTMKPFLMGPALQGGVANLAEVFPINGPRWRVGRRTITDVHPYSALSLWDVLVKSSNIGMCMLAGRMTNQEVYEAVATFNFGRQTGVELPGEDPGLLFSPKKWDKLTRESIAQGYAVMVTPLQLARAMAVYANGGHLVRPRIVKGELDDEGRLIASHADIPLSDTPTIISPAVAQDMRRVMADVLVRGTASSSRSSNFNVFGKTGTAHIAKNGNYNESSYTSSFIGGAPYEDPRLVIAFIIHEPDRSIAHHGGTVSAPGAVRVLERACAYMQLPPSPKLMAPPPQIVAHLYNYNPKLYAQPASASASVDVGDAIPAASNHRN